MKWKVFVLVCAVCLLLATGCGEDEGAEVVQEPDASSSPPASPAPQLKTYTNDEYSFSLGYPADWNQGDPPLSSMSQEGDFAIAFGNVVEMGAPTDAERERLMMVGVLARRLPGEGTEADFRAALEGMAAEFERAMGELPQGNITAEVTETGMGGFAGMPSLITEVTFDIDAFPGLRLRQRQYIFGKGDALYSVSLYALEDRWAQDEAVLESVAQSFVIHE